MPNYWSRERRGRGKL